MTARLHVAAAAGAWLVALGLVVLGSRALVYALAPQPALIGSQLEYEAGGPRLVVLTLCAVALALMLSVAVVWVVAVAVSERARLEELSAPVTRISVPRIAVRALGLWCASSTVFALLESYLHWRAGLGWHGIHCLVGPVHRDAIPILAALSLVASALGAVINHLVGWMRRVVAALRRQSPRLQVAGGTMRCASGVFSPSVSRGWTGCPRAPPRLISNRVRRPLAPSLDPVTSI